MSLRFDDTAKEDIRNRADIVGIVSRYVNLKQTGQTFKGLCPFHKEKTPSFNVNPVQGFFHCFGCGKGGDVFSFIQEIENVDFSEALKILADETGVVLKRDHNQTDQHSNRDQSAKKTDLLEIHSLAARYYYSCIRSSSQAVSYFKSRDLKAQTVKEFGLGYAPDQWSGLCDYLQKNNVPLPLIVECGLAVQKESGSVYDRFRNRIIFPIHDFTGKIIAFAGRGMDKNCQPKYLNSPETALYRKNRVLYGIHKARQSIRDKGYMLIVEGYMDYLSLYQAGICNVAATSGTAFTNEHAHLIRRFTQKAVLVFDGDVAGVNAAQRAVFVLAPSNLNLLILQLPSGDDPDSFIKENGKNEFLKLAERATPAFTFMIDKTVSENDSSSAFGKKQIIEKLTPYMKSLSDPLIRDEFAKELSEKLDISVHHVTKIFRGERSDLEENPQTESVNNKQFLNSLEGNFLRILLTSPSLIDQAKQYVAPQTLTNKLSKNIYSIILDSYARNGSLDSILDEAGDLKLRNILSMLMVSPALTDHIHDDMVQKIIFLRKKFLRHEIVSLRHKLKNDPENRMGYLEQLKEFSTQLKELD
ncbi:DNA primase [Chitinispirillum alkaliphilum]|nr:DNA primase [Chitinispirillum alkaliphilum]